METQKLTFNKIKVNQLDLQDQKLAYANHVHQFKENELKPETIEVILNENVIRCFSFIISKEGHRYWFTKLDAIIYKEKKKDEYLKEKNKEIKIIGFSATPNLEYKPFDNVISSYSIYDAFLDNVIVRPKIKWLTYDTILNHQEMVTIMKYIIDTSKIYHKKIIVWCGMIELCIQMAILWQRVFENYLICVDTSKESNEFKNYEDFYKAESNSILFCANKHREGSDIKNLDCCIFLDKVQNRCPKLFIQCIGRVLRLNKDKEFGLIIDIRAKNSYHICNNINNYLQLKENIYPWKYKYEKINVNVAQL